MYKARVEAVSGTKVRAGGKWLTCIGNKPVRVGDIVWTDGRCVYGYEQTPQQPIVITGKEELGIPLSGYLGEVYRKRFVGYYKIKTGTIKYFPADDFSDDKIYLWNTNNERTIIYDKNAYALNIDSKNNYYSITKDWSGRAATPETLKFKLLKNNIVFKSIDLQDILSTNFHVNRVHAFIEDENNWQIIVYLAENILNTDPALFNSLLIMDAKGITYNVWHTEDSPNLTIPMHDGFYYKIDTPEIEGYYENQSPVFDAVLYSPEGKVITTIPKCSFIACLSAYKLSRNKFLISVHNSAFGLEGRTMTTLLPEEGLYVCDDGILTKLDHLILTSQCLRPMKKYKRWWERIQTIDTD